MDQNHKEYKELLEQQLQHTKEKIEILDEMDLKLHEMKKIVEYAAKQKLTVDEINESTANLNILKKGYDNLEKLLHRVTIKWDN